ncbi:MAG: M23 family metallopeptidase [Candidatus Glassbacteria bacterium]
MPFKDWTILIVPHNDIQSHRFKVSRWLVFMGVVTGLVLSVGISVLVISSHSKNFDFLRFINLQHENQILTQKLQDVEGKIGQMDQLIGGLMDENQIFRRIAGLELIDDEITKVGIGGTFVGKNEELIEVNGPLAMKVYRQEDHVDLLLRKAALIGQSLQEAIGSLEANSDRWTHTPSIMPTEGFISSGFGKRSHPIYHISQQHNGIDISTRRGAPIIAPADGMVLMVKQQIGYGLTLALDHGYGLITRYAHCSKSNVRVGQRVKRGDVIGFVGDTGITTGPNLHYEVYAENLAKDPLDYILDNYVP